MKRRMKALEVQAKVRTQLPRHKEIKEKTKEKIRAKTKAKIRAKTKARISEEEKATMGKMANRRSKPIIHRMQVSQTLHQSLLLHTLRRAQKAKEKTKDREKEKESV